MHSIVETAIIEIRRLKAEDTALALSQCGLRNSDIEKLKLHLRELVHITCLDLSENTLFSESLQHVLEAMPHLIELNLGSNSLDDDVIPILLRFKQLQKVNLYQNGITDKGAQQLLDSCHCLFIKISHNELSPEMEAKLAALAEYNQQHQFKRQFGIKNGNVNSRTKFIDEHWEKHRESLVDLNNSTFDTTTYKEETLERFFHRDVDWMKENDVQQLAEAGGSIDLSVTNK